MKLSAILVPLTFLRIAVAEGTAIVGALKEVHNVTTNLGNSVANWDGSMLGMVPILTENTFLLVSVIKGTKTAEKSEPLNLGQAIEVANAASTLVKSVNSTLSIIINAKPKFDKLSMSPVTLANLGLQKNAADEMSTAIISKVPADYQGFARSLVTPITNSFQLAIDTFHP
ncbi:putative antigenic cell wall galactomannoprotein [Canariomyces notabilis]|uniref:Antigenic cell wall galactomannoprotein n=1 Tax=Canariomyces notabilis TaxID=2074819 RepID=A0AAN6QIY1_9PEZI|nr:putative antigenic cell wall galactomannoprotein [Canariomyces arenarius]